MCDFEDAGMCGWTGKSAEGGYTWERRQSGHPLPNSGPSSDYTIGTSTGTHAHWSNFLNWIQYLKMHGNFTL